MQVGAADGGRRPSFFAPPPPSQPGATVGEAIYEAFVIVGSPGQRFVVGRLGALVGTILGLGIAICLLNDPRSGNVGIGALAAVAGVVAGQVMMRRSILPMAVMDALLLFANLVLAIGGATNEAMFTILPAAYVSLGTGVFLIRRLRASAGHLAAIGASYAYVLAAGPSQHAPLTRWVAVVAAVVISGGFVRWIVAKVIDLATAEHEASQEAVRTTVRLEEVSEAKSEFLARMSHELRTPLNVVVGFADVLRDGLVGPLDARQQSYVQDIAGSGRDLLQLVDQLLDVSKVEAGQLDLDLSRVDIAGAVSDAELLVRARARERGVALRVDRPADPILADADSLRVRQVAWNLLGNAVKFTPRGGSVEVRVTADDDLVRVVVRDTGPGIDPADQDRIFEPYEQGRAAQASGGSGIGLALCRRLIEAHGGHLWVDSEVGAGSTFTFEVPRRAPVDPVDEPTPLAPDPVAWADLEQALLVAGSLANRRTMAKVGERFAWSSAVLLPILALITPGSVTVRLGIAGLAIAGALIAMSLRSMRDGMPMLAVDLIGYGGTLGVSLGLLVASPFADLAALTYGWAILAHAALVRARGIAVQVATVMVCYAFVLVIDDTPRPVDHWIAVAMLVTVNAVVVGWVAARLREAMSEALSARLAAEATRSQVEAISAHKSDFLANTSHELCTPLNAIIGFAQVLRDDTSGPLEPRQAEYLEDILVSGQQLLALITDLLDLAKLEAGRLPRTPQPTSVDVLVRQVAAELSPMAGRRGVRLSVEAGDDLPVVGLDAQNLYHALSNLIANGIKFTSDGGRVEVLARRAGERILLSVRDNGIGILPEQRPHLFEAFHQGTRPLPEHARGGTGLGLTLAKQLVDLEGGSISLESTPDVGSTFTIELPVPAAVTAGSPW